MAVKSIIAENLVKHYRHGEVKALDGLSLEVEEGTVLSLLGPNGAGKTTTVRILSTLLQPDSGHATVAGIDALKEPAKVRSIIGLSGQYAAVDETLTGWDNLVMFGRLYHLSNAQAQARATELLAQFSLSDDARRPIKTFSGGMRRRLDLAASLIIKPRVLFLDEPTTGLDPRGRQEMWGLLQAAHAFEERFACGPNGFPQVEATWFHARSLPEEIAPLGELLNQIIEKSLAPAMPSHRWSPFSRVT